MSPTPQHPGTITPMFDMLVIDPALSGPVPPPPSSPQAQSSSPAPIQQQSPVVSSDEGVEGSKRKHVTEGGVEGGGKGKENIPPI